MGNIIGEIFYYLKTYKKFWLLPLVVIFVIFACLLIISETVPLVSPFIYTLF